MESRAIKELYSIIKLEGVTREAANEAREAMLNQWVNDHICEVEYEQHIIKNHLTSEDQDFIKYYLAYQIGDKLMNDCIYMETSETKIKTKLYALKR